MHESCDGGGVIAKADGGYYYVSNSEQGEYPYDFDIAQDDSNPKYRMSNATIADGLTGGAYSLEFDAEHNLVSYTPVLQNTAGNCAGGVTPWGTWVSCEERREFGRCWQTDPSGTKDAVPTDVTGPRGIKDYGYFEAMAWDSDRNVGYVADDDWQKETTQPAFRGAVIRYTPDKAARECLEATADEDKWCALEHGSHAYLKLDSCKAGTFEWVADIESSNPMEYGGSEGIHVQGDMLTFVTVKENKIFQLNLTDHTYTEQAVPFPQEPDNIRGFGDVMYVCTDGDEKPDDGIWGIDGEGSYQVFSETGHNYPAGVAFSPDGKRMIFCMWGEACYSVARDDGMAFDEPSAGANYAVVTTTTAVGK